MYGYFNFQENNYGTGTVVQIYEKYRGRFKFYSHLVFEGCNNEKNCYSFRSLYNKWDTFDITEEQLKIYVERVVEPHSVFIDVQVTPKRDPKHIEGIISAWAWYILVMFFGLFLIGPISKIIVWVLASAIFFNWRHKKINGG